MPIDPKQLTDEIQAWVVPPGGVIIVKGMDHDSWSALLGRLELLLNPPDVLFIRLDEDRAIEALDEEGMAACGWFRGDPAGDEDDAPPTRGDDGREDGHAPEDDDSDPRTRDGWSGDPGVDLAGDDPESGRGSAEEAGGQDA